MFIFKIDMDMKSINISFKGYDAVPLKALHISQSWDKIGDEFKQICDKYGNKYLLPPKSISIMGQTGWSTAYAKENAGGGGLMA